MSTSCTGLSEDDDHNGYNVREAATSVLDSSGTQQLLDVVQHYYELKDALVADNAGDVKRFAAEMQRAVVSFHIHNNLDTSVAVSALSALEHIDQSLQSILASNDNTCEQQRLAFQKLSDNMFSLIQAAEVHQFRIYKMYCPMAFHERGAYWLSQNPSVKNPYFGQKMLECGEIIDTLQ